LRELSDDIWVEAISVWLQSSHFRSNIKEEINQEEKESEREEGEEEFDPFTCMDSVHKSHDYDKLLGP
jgi:hypothetical protein